MISTKANPMGKHEMTGITHRVVMRVGGGLLGWVATCVGLAVDSDVAAQPVVYPRPGLANASTGLVESFVAGGWYRGSGVVARDPRLIYSCAHVFHDRGRWATDYRFYRGYHGRAEPAPWQGSSPRGLFYFTSYARAVRLAGSDSNRAFAADFTIMYGNRSFGPAARALVDGVPLLRSARAKRIVGYPSEIDFTGADGFNYQHATPWFSKRAWQLFGAFHDFIGVSTGAGNSGGSVFVRDGAGGQALAGILVSGSYDTAGVVALDPAKNVLATRALGEQGRTRVFANSKAGSLPDGDGRFLIREIEVAGIPGSISELRLDLSVRAAPETDVEAYLRSPDGRVRWVAKKGTVDPGGVVLDSADFTVDFSGQSANGTWSLWIRDAKPGFPTVFENAALRITAL